MLTPAEAWQLIDAELAPLPAAELPRADAVFGILAADLAADLDQPSADISAMDGYALAGEEPVGATLPIVDIAAAGRPAARGPAPGEAVKIMTGAMLPAGADRVLPVEQTSAPDAASVTIGGQVAAGDHIRRRGEIVRAGEPLLRAGMLLTPAAISLAAGHGYATLPVVRPPRVAVLTTGDEIVAPEAVPGVGQLRDSNTSFLVAAGRTLGLDFENLGIAGDDREELARKIGAGLAADVLLLCGGVSKGDFDHVEEVLADLGCRQLFDHVAIMPGQPLVAARHAGGWVLGLPGNPASVMATFWLFGRPLLRRLQGLADGFWHGALAGRLRAPAPGARGRDRFLPASVTVRDGQIEIDPAVPKGSHDVLRYSHGSALLRVPAGTARLEAGDRAEILPLGHWPVL